MSAQYLCYDVKGIQQFIFSVPRLKYVIGASLMVDEFDRSSAEERSTGVEAIYAGGGKGAFRCEDEKAAEELRRKLVSRAHGFGLDLRIGASADFEEASRHADDLYPYLPDDLEGEPCAASGLWPVKKPGDVHPIVEKRGKFVKERGWRKLDERVLNGVEAYLPDELRSRRDELEFVTVVRAKSRKLSDEDRLKAKATDVALGSRGRWAVVSMDGNDLGSQFRKYSDPPGLNEARRLERKTTWVKTMSAKLRETTENAFYQGLGETIADWWNDVKDDARLLELYRACKTIVLPFRPLILGGDDLLFLSSSTYALELTKRVATRFEALSREAAQSVSSESRPLWPATGDRLTIDAGVAYCSIGLPLSESIQYAEALLANAKSKFRDKRREGEPAPAAIDWEFLTESTLDAPNARRTRDLRFRDADRDVDVELCARPAPLEKVEGYDGFTLAEIEATIERVRKLPTSVCETFATALRRPYAERAATFLAYAKRRPEALEWFDEGIEAEDSLGTCWRLVDGKQVCNFLDAFSIVREEKRMSKETTR